MTHWLHTTRFTRGKLPHWEVTEGRYFVTVRCADSLPGSIVDRLSEIHLGRHHAAGQRPDGPRDQRPLQPNRTLWQREWFDRWMRSDSEYEKCVGYILNNPVKAGLVAGVGENPRTK